MGNRIFYRRNLPHYQPESAIFFVTYRLTNSLPKSVVEMLKKENDLMESAMTLKTNSENIRKALHVQRKKYFAKFDQFLDNANSGAQWLKILDIATIVNDSILYRNGSEYELFASCIMPNHVHQLIGVGELFTAQAISDTVKNSSKRNLTEILRDLKKYTARECNIILKRTGQFWHRESYDHVVRNENEFANIINYIIQNPVKAGLVENWEEWEWTYLHQSYL